MTSGDNSDIFDKLDNSPPFLQLFGHERERLFLQQQLREGKMPHALLFEGAPGIGKASLAFHLAYHILAGQERQAAKPGRLWPAPAADCPVWRKMAQGAHPGLLYMRRGRDPKSLNLRNAITVDDMRRVSRFLQQTAADNGWRIVLVDSADDMNRNAANAVLKTLEEPPAKALFILISHHAGRLLPTIRSRCQSIRFKPLPEEIMRRALPPVAAALGCEASAAATGGEVIALAEGSLRRALLLTAAGGAAIISAADNMLRQPVFSVPQGQSLAERLSKRDNGAAYEVFLQHIMDFLQNQARFAARQGELAQAAALADFADNQEQAIQETQAFNLDKKQFILVLLQQMHQFLHANSVPARINLMTKPAEAAM